MLGHAETRDAVDPRRAVHRREQRSIGAPVNRDVEVRDLGHGERVAGRVVDRDVAVDGGDTQELAVAGRGEDRERVIDAGIAVEDDRSAGDQGRGPAARSQHATWRVRARARACGRRASRCRGHCPSTSCRPSRRRAVARTRLRRCRPASTTRTRVIGEIGEVEP